VAKLICRKSIFAAAAMFSSVKEAGTPGAAVLGARTEMKRTNIVAAIMIATDEVEL
jgi:hypothetical protein